MKNCYRITNIVVSTDYRTVTLEPSRTANFGDTNNICFKLSADIPDSADNFSVFFTVNGATIPVWNKYGNPVLGKDIKSLRCYAGYYGATSPHIILKNYPRCFDC